MALDFPASPTVGQTFTDPQGTTWKWDGVKWTAATVGSYVPLSGGTMQGPLILAADPTTALGAATRQYVDNGPASHNVGRNQLHNGLMDVNQRQSGPYTTNGAWSLDRWRLMINNDTASVTQQGLTDTDRGSIGDEAAQNCLQNVFAGSAAAGSYTFIYQTVESVRRLGGKTVILSVWAKAASGAPSLCVEWNQNFGSSGSTNVGGVAGWQAISTSWARYVWVIALPSTAAKTVGGGNDGTGFQFDFSSANQSHVQSNTIQLWGAQLEIAQPGQTQPTPLERLSWRQDLANCMRFYQAGQAVLGGYATAGTGVSYAYPFPVQMRATPTMQGNWYQLINLGNQTFYGVSPAAFQPYAVAAGNGGFALGVNWTASADL